MCELGGFEERSIEELLADPVVQRALWSLGRRMPPDPCPRCLDAPVWPQSREGWCQPCTTWMNERIKASRRRSYHRTKPGGDGTAPDPVDEGTPGELPRPAAGYRTVYPGNE